MPPFGISQSAAEDPAPYAASAQSSCRLQPINFSAIPCDLTKKTTTTTTKKKTTKMKKKKKKRKKKKKKMKMKKKKKKTTAKSDARTR